MNPFRLLQSCLNRLLPFTRPGTPLLQDLVHTLALCAFLYFAPAIFEANNNRSAPPAPTDDPQRHDHAAPDPVPHPAVEAEAEARELLPAEQHDGPQAGFDAQFDSGTESEDGEDEDGDVAAFANDNDNNADGQQPAAAQRAAANANARNTSTVGAKKARSLARRDQRRAYHEFVRSQAEAQRAREAEGAAEREAELFEEKRRRAVAEAALEERRVREREERRERERRGREEEARAQREALGAVRRGLEGARGLVEVREMVGRREGEGREWLERLLRAGGVVGRGREADGCVRMVTAGGWVVRVEEGDMQMAWKRAAGLHKAKVTYKDLGEALEEVLLSRA